ncbi:MAG: 30S ribosomal protein S1 [Clostridia bacterium]|nr:30S ribosomal protein S1 [Clostridia bacterium]
MTEELQEKIIWQNVNSSKEKGKILTGKIVAIEVEKMREDEIVCAIVDFKGIKVLVPATEMIVGGKNEKNVIRNMMGAEIKFIVMETDEETSKAVGSRIKAMQRLKEINLKKLQVGDKIYGKVIGVWKKYIRLECVGIDFLIDAKDLQYGYIEDVSKIYKINEPIKIVIKEISEENQNMKISVKELLEDPFKNIRANFTEKGEYLASITGYTKNGIFANIAQGVDTVCTLPTWLDRPPLPKEKVIVKIYKILPEKRKIYSSIIKVIGSDVND